MILTITVRFRGSPGPDRPGSAQPRPAGGPGEPFTSLLTLAEPAVLLIAEAAGLGLLGKVLLATVLRGARHAVAA